MIAAISAGRGPFGDGRPVLTSVGSARPSSTPVGTGAAGDRPPARVTTGCDSDLLTVVGNLLGAQPGGCDARRG